jgi:Tfp pilus assembly protein FimT
VKPTEARMDSGKRGWRAEDGRTIIEVLIVVIIGALMTSFAIPQMLASRRLQRSTVLAREVLAQLRFTRQQAMSQRQAFTFQYDNSTKTIKIFDHQNNNNGNPACLMPGTQVLTTLNYPNTACSVTALTVPLASTVPASEITYGVPSGISNSNLGDGSTLTALSGTVVNITFQPDGTVMDSSKNYVNKSLYFYNSVVPTQTATAISVLGAAGRVKVWRYSTSASKYSE